MSIRPGPAAGKTPCLSDTVQSPDHVTLDALDLDPVTLTYLHAHCHHTALDGSPAIDVDRAADLLDRRELERREADEDEALSVAWEGLP